MSAGMIAGLVDAALLLAGGLVATLCGFRVLGRKPGEDEKFDAWYSKWGKHLKWLGPLVIAFGIVRLIMAFFE